MSDSTGLMESLKRMVDTLLSIIQTRLELLSAEIEEERVRVGQLLLYGAIAFFFFAMAVLLLTFLVVAVFWDNHLLLVLSGLIALFLIAGTVAWFAFRKVSRSRLVLFSTSLSALAEDREGLVSRP
ncbi:phage holin family protein [Sideroxydans sp.]